MINNFIEVSEGKVELLSTAFPDVNFKLFQAYIDDSAYFSVFYCTLADEGLLQQLWKRINSLISVEHQTKIENDFTCWNIYLVFSIPMKISNSLKYLIENDTYFMRKIVDDCNNGKEIASYLDNYILGKDISFGPSEIPKEVEIQYSQITLDLLSADLPLNRSQENQKARDEWLNGLLQGIDSNEI